MPIFKVDVWLNDIIIEADSSVDAMFGAKEDLDPEIWPYISRMSVTETAESKKEREKEEK